ncbi:MAG: signal peptidase I [Candidatus Eisenbacteria bacterium]
MQRNEEPFPPPQAPAQPGGEAARESGGGHRLSRLLAAVRDVVTMLGLLLVLQVGIVQAFNVPSGSMEGTILAGDFLLADKLTLGPRTPQWLGIPGTKIGVDLPAWKLPGLRSPRRGDIVVVEVPVDRTTPYVKRVVAVGGDRVEIRDKSLYVNGARVEESTHVVHRDRWTAPPGTILPGIPADLGNRDNFGPIVIPEGSVFLMGDNRDYSLDSRFFGPVPVSNIVGRARVVTLSWDREDHLPIWKRLRLSRFGTSLQ